MAPCGLSFVSPTLPPALAFTICLESESIWFIRIASQKGGCEEESEVPRARERVLSCARRSRNETNLVIHCNEQKTRGIDGIKMSNDLQFFEKCKRPARCFLCNCLCKFFFALFEPNSHLPRSRTRRGHHGRYFPDPLQCIRGTQGLSGKCKIVLDVEPRRTIQNSIIDQLWMIRSRYR